MIILLLVPAEVGERREDTTRRATNIAVECTVLLLVSLSAMASM